MTELGKCLQQPLSKGIGEVRRVGLVGDYLGDVLGRF